MRYNKIKTFPGYTLTVADDPIWPAGETPKKLYISFTGIVTGWKYVEWMDRPPNRSLRLEYVDDPVQPYYQGDFYGPNEHWYVTYAVHILGTFCHLENADGRFGFFYFADGVSFSGENMIVPPDTWYYGGSFQVMSRISTVEPSFRTTIEQLGIEKAKKTYIEFAPISTNLNWQKIYRRSDATRILVKKDTSR